MNQSINLSRFAAALDSGLDIKLVSCFRNGKRPSQLVFKKDAAKILFGVLFVHRNITAAWSQPDTGNCCFSSTCCVKLFLRHGYSAPLDIQKFRLLGLMRVFVTGINF